MTEPTVHDEEPFNWDQWPRRRAELATAIAKMREQFASMEPRPELEGLRGAGEKLINDLENVIGAGDEEYRQLHPGAQFEPS